jgi:hypothetical protein
MAYLAIFAVEMFVTGGLIFGATTASGMSNVATVNQTALLAPTIQESTNVFTAAWAIITGVAPYLRLLLQIVFLWCPTVFVGDMLWLYWFVCFPISVGFVASLVFIARGVHSA